MAAYPDGTIFNSAQTFPASSSFGKGCVFASGSVFDNPCYFDEGCVFESGCALIKSNSSKPPHETGNGCIFNDGCTIDYTIIGTANIIRNPSVYSPVSEGADTIVGDGNNTADGCDLHSVAKGGEGQIVSDCKASENWKEASNPEGFVGSGVVRDTEWGINNG